jgi:hypothetical protein
MGNELAFAVAIVIVLLWLALHFGRKQIETMRSLRDQPELAPEDRSYYVAQSWRRLAGCGLMIAFAGMLFGWYAFGLNRQADELRVQGEEAAARDEHPGKFDPEQKRSYNILSLYWITASFLLMGMVLLACTDMWAIRRYGMRHLRRIQSDRRAALEKEMEMIRSRRNGMG